MPAYRCLSVVILALAAAAPIAAEDVRVSGASAAFPTALQHTVDGKPINFRLTGASMRKKLFINVYSIGSYVQDGVKAGSAEQLVNANGVKLLHLVIERDIGGAEMSEAFRSSVALNYPAGSFADELAKFDKALRACTVSKGDQVWMTNSPAGFRCVIPGKLDVSIPNAAFAKAIWEIYFGRNNLGDALKRGLVARL